MEVIKDLVKIGSTQGNKGYTMKPTSITIHTTGNTSKGANAKSHANYIKNPTTTVSWHWTTDEDYAIQHFEHNIQCWHAGNNAGNTTSIGIEMCVNSDGDFNKTIENTIELVKKIMRETGITTIKKHQDWSSKYCPKELLDMGIWNTFVDRCLKQEYVGDINAQLVSAETVHYVKGEVVVVEWADGKSTVPKETPKINLVSKDNTKKVECHVESNGTNRYYFDRNILELDRSKEYELEIALQGDKNISEKKTMRLPIKL